MTEPFPRLLSVWLTALTLVTGPVCGEPAPEPESTAVQVHGFVSQSVAHTSANRFAGSSTDTSYAFRSMAINASYQADPDLLFAVELGSHRFGNSNHGTPQIDYALVDYRVLDLANSQLGLRAGRVKNPIGLYNETRDVPTTMPSILLPQSIYLERSRALLLASDAVFLRGTHANQYGHWSMDAGLGYPQANDEETERAVLLNRNWAGNLDADISALIRLFYETADGQLRFVGTHADARMDFDAQPSDQAFGLNSGHIEISYDMFSAQYESLNWSLTAELLRTRSVVSGFGAVLPDTVVEGDNFYLQGSWRPRYDLEFFARYDQTIHDNDDPDGKAAAARSPALIASGLPGIAAHNNYGRDWTIGGRWNLDAAWTLRAEHHWVEGTTWLGRTDNPDLATTDENWRLFLMSVEYRF
ncbi:MAG: hypothetical protein KDI42_08885 [Gammaproteobacteria bacterium]|nr:hypothetical protein [Gammaproteobacteria bacterium]